MPSMGSVGDAYDNAMAESFFATLARARSAEPPSLQDAGRGPPGALRMARGLVQPTSASLCLGLLVTRQLREEATDQRDRFELDNYPSAEAGRVRA